jgi:hypothetical protein
VDGHCLGLPVGGRGGIGGWLAALGFIWPRHIRLVCIAFALIGGPLLATLHHPSRYQVPRSCRGRPDRVAQRRSASCHRLGRPIAHVAIVAGFSVHSAAPLPS